MRMIGAILIVTICCVVSFAQQSVAQPTEKQSQAKEQSVSSQTENKTLPERTLTLSDILQIQIRLSEVLHQQGLSLPADTEKLRLQGIELVPETRFVIKDGAIYLALTNDYLVPMTGGGASGCLPNSPKPAGQMIFLAPKTKGEQPPAQDPTKKN